MTEDQRGLQSMTGFGAAESEQGARFWRWEVRSVNGKALDLKFRMPGGAEVLEQPLRQKLRQLYRGSIVVSLRIDRDESPETLVVDEEALAAVATALAKVRQYVDCDKPRPEAVLNMRGVLSTPSNELEWSEELCASLLAGFDEALERLLSARRSEGCRVASLLHQRCEQLSAKVSGLRQETLTTRDDLAARLRAQLADLLAEHVDEDRLAQEAALLAIRADVSEELDRLEVHTAAFVDLLRTDGAAGRRLEFLTQELMREASTLTAKLHTAALKSEGLDLKELVDSLREQVLNIA